MKIDGRGMLAKSKAGHDKNKVYVILNEDESYVYLVDGQTRTILKPKRKKKKHVQIINIQYDISAIDDVAIKRILKLHKEKSE
ncbi:KOW domain-containing RNA-binding protein [Lachnospiraceae bacterium LCP25S3_G4]